MREDLEVDLIDLVEDRHHGQLNDFVFQCRDFQLAYASVPSPEVQEGSLLSPIRFSALKFFGIVALFSATLLGFLPLASAQGKVSAADTGKTDSPPSKSRPGISPDKYIAATVGAMFVAGVLILVFQLKKAKRKREMYDGHAAIQREEMASRPIDLAGSESPSSILGLESQWKELYIAAYGERDPARLVQRVNAAQAAIRELMRQLEVAGSKRSQQWRELEISLGNLHVLLHTESTKHHAA